MEGPRWRSLGHKEEGQKDLRVEGAQEGWTGRGSSGMRALESHRQTERFQDRKRQRETENVGAER